MIKIDKVLILSCSTGEGHNSAARALKKAFSNKNIKADIKDPVSFKSEKAKDVVASLYNNMIKKTPNVFGALYKLGDIYSSTNLPSPIYHANKIYKDSLKKFIIDNKYEAVISTHLYGMEAMTAIKEDSDFNIKTYGVLTDYTSIPFLKETKLDMYFVPNLHVKEELINSGYKEESIVVTGIPVSPEFSLRIKKEDARKSLDIPFDKKVILVMTGGIGCENMAGLLRELVKYEKEETLILVLVGRNKKLKDKIIKENMSTKIKTVDFTREVYKYIRAADVVVSKPGGLSSTEVAVSNVPLIHVNKIPGCETKNVSYFSEKGMSYGAKNNSDAAFYADKLCYDNKLSLKMKESQKENIPLNASEDIVRRVIGK